MGMFDYYRPAGEHRCPSCRRLLREWQGKDGPNGMFVWAEGIAGPIEQRVDDEIALDREARERISLPRSFAIYSHDCPDHQPIEADCTAPDGTWISTVVRASFHSK